MCDRIMNEIINFEFKRKTNERQPLRCFKNSLERKTSILSQEIVSLGRSSLLKRTFLLEEKRSTYLTSVTSESSIITREVRVCTDARARVCVYVCVRSRIVLRTSFTIMA